MLHQVTEGPAQQQSDAPMKARVVLLQTQSEAAGAQEISRILARGLAERGYEVRHVFCFRRTAAFDHDPHAFFCAKERPRGVLALTSLFRSLVSYLKDLQPDAVVCFQHYGNIIGTLAARCAGTKTIIVNRNSSKELIPKWLQAVDLTFGIAGMFQRVVVNSGSVEKEYDRYPARYRRGIVRIDHGFEARSTKLSRAEARNRFGIPDNVVLLGSVARLHPGKNLEVAIGLLPGRNWHLALAGQGPAHASLVAAARTAGVLERVHFVGELSPSGIGDFLRSLDVFVFPSIAETFGLAAVEAAQAGVPVVANDLEVLREVLAFNGKPCALFVDVADRAAFAGAVEKILDEVCLRQVLTTQAKELSRRYSSAAMVAQYAALLDQMICQKRHTSS
jgi:glycosyltransferase involved in cell wall biosynthesis